MDKPQATRTRQEGNPGNATAMAFPETDGEQKFDAARIISYPTPKATQKTHKQMLADRLMEIRIISASMYDAVEAVDLRKASKIVQGIRYLIIEAQQLLDKEASCS